MQVILDSSFARPGSAPIWGGKKGEFRDWTSGLALMHIHKHVSLNAEDMIVLDDFKVCGRSSFRIPSNCTVSNGKRKSSSF